MAGMYRPSPRARDKSGYLSEDTIAALATPVGGPVAIIRLSGPGSFAALDALAGKRVTAEGEPRALHRVSLRSNAGTLLDEALAVFFPAPKSFTGEDCAELHIHGGSYTAGRVLEELARLGARQALPGEFSFRAVRNGKMNLSQAEALADLIGASNENAVALALEKMSGTQAGLIHELAGELRMLSTLGEVGIDFSDQDVDEVSLPRLKARALPALERLSRLAASYARGRGIQDGVRVSFVGLPNAGKSSFFNALLGEDRSLVSEVAGTTRDVVRERITLQGKTASVTLRLEDTAGLRTSSDRVERMGVERTRRAAREAELLLLIVDATAPLEPLFEEWRELGRPGARTFGILTKRDLVDEAFLDRLLPCLGELGVESWARTSSVTGAGIAEAAALIADFSETRVRRLPGEILLTRLDHLEAATAAQAHLERARGAPELDLFAADVRQALHALGPLIGETLPDDILGRIFSEFCIGK